MSTVSNIIKKVAATKKNKKKYLQIGCASVSPSGFKKKVVIDERDSNATENISTHEFFSKNKDKFDVIYITNVKDYKQLILDYNNSVDALKKDGVIIINNMFPPNIQLTDPRYCGDSYKVLEYFIKNGFEYGILMSEYGLTYVFPNEKKIEGLANPMKYDKFIQFVPLTDRVFIDEDIWGEEIEKIFGNDKRKTVAKGERGLQDPTDKGRVGMAD